MRRTLAAVAVVAAATACGVGDRTRTDAHHARPSAEATPSASGWSVGQAKINARGRFVAIAEDKRGRNRVVLLDGTTTRVLTPGTSLPAAFAWFPDGSAVLVSSRSVGSRPES